MCNFEEILFVTFRAKYPFFLGTAADAKAQPFDMYPLILLLSVLLPPFIFIFSPHIDGT